VAPTLSVSEAHQINDFAMRLLKQAHPEITDVTLHIDFESDFPDKKTKLDPKRQALLSELERVGISGFERVYLHYTDNQVEVELLFAQGLELGHLAPSARALVASTPWLGSIRLYSRNPA